jgi:hypothetical protein
MGWTQHRVICPNDKNNMVVPAKRNVIPGTNAARSPVRSAHFLARLERWPHALR